MGEGVSILKIEEQIYRKIGDIELSLRIFKPAGWSPGDRRAAIIFFFGGGWVNGNMDHFRSQSEHLASRGMVALTPQYRIRSLHGTTPHDSAADAQAALWWVRDHAGELGVDGQRIAVGGGSAGGHLALCCALIQPLEEALCGVNDIPTALVLFNPVVDTTLPGVCSDRMGKNPEILSPIHHVGKGAPPAILFHGTDDTTVPYESILRFWDAMKECGNQCTVIPYEGQKHGFFNQGLDRDPFCYRDTLRRADDFLTDLGYTNEK